MTAALEPIWAPLVLGAPFVAFLLALGRRRRPERDRARRVVAGAQRLRREWDDAMGVGR